MAIRIIVLFLVACSAGAGCQLPFGLVGSAAPPQQLTGVKWQLVEGQVAGEQFETNGDVDAHLRFTDQEHQRKEKAWAFGGNGGCNGFGGAYRADDTDLHVLELTYTLIGCEDRRGDVEELYFEVLNHASSYEVQGGELHISGENGALRFEAVSDESEGSS